MTLGDKPVQDTRSLSPAERRHDVQAAQRTAALLWVS